MTAGRRDQLITLQTYTTTQDDHNEEVETWGTVATEWARYEPGRGDERRQAAMEQGSLPAIFGVLENEVTRAVTVRDRIVYDGANWDITDNIKSTRWRGMREIAATRAA